MTKSDGNVKLAADCNLTVSWSDCSTGTHHFLMSNRSPLQKNETFKAMLLPSGDNWEELQYISGKGEKTPYHFSILDALGLLNSHCHCTAS